MISDDKFYVGDHVLLRAIVEYDDGHRLIVHVPGSQSDEDMSVETSRVIRVTQANLPEESPDGSMIGGRAPDNGNARMFTRNDAEGHCDRPSRRFDRHWWDVVAQKWITWPDVLMAGGDPNIIYVQAKKTEKTMKCEDMCNEYE